MREQGPAGSARRAVGPDQKKAQDLADRGHAFFRDEQFDQAVDSLGEAVELLLELSPDPSRFNVDLFTNVVVLGEAQFALGRAKESTAMMRAAVSLVDAAGLTFVELDAVGIKLAAVLVALASLEEDVDPASAVAHASRARDLFDLPVADRLRQGSKDALAATHRRINALADRLERQQVESPADLPQATGPDGVTRSRGRLRRPGFIVALVLAVGFWMFVTPDGKQTFAPLVVRLRLAAPGVFGHGEYKFLRTENGKPETFSSCRPVRVVINDQRRPAGAAGLVEQAVAQVAEASGLTMTIIGSTSEQPSENRPLRQGGYGPGWPPVLISWTDPQHIPTLSSNRIGEGGPDGIVDPATGRGYYVTGQIFLDTPQLNGLLRDDQQAEVRAIVMHELGHVLGLDHVNSPYELMQPAGHGLTTLGAGDRAGLKRLGQGPCI